MKYFRNIFDLSGFSLLKDLQIEQKITFNYSKFDESENKKRIFNNFGTSSFFFHQEIFLGKPFLYSSYESYQIEI